MKDFFIDMWDMLTEPVEDGFWGWFFRILIWIVILLFVLMILYGIFYLVDSSFRPKKDGEGVVVGKYFTPAHITISYVTSGKSTIPITTYHPDRWSIDIEIDGRSDNVGVTESYSNSISEGTKVWVRYVSGRISGSIYIKEIL